MRCKGTTKSGTRCKRTAAGETEYCSTHMDQALGANPEPRASTKKKAGPKAKEKTKPDENETIFGESDAKSGDEEWLDDWVDTLVDAAVVGAVVVAALTVGRLLRVF